MALRNLPVVGDVAADGLDGIVEQQRGIVASCRIEARQPVEFLFVASTKLALTGLLKLAVQNDAVCAPSEPSPTAAIIVSSSPPKSV